MFSSKEAGQMSKISPTMVFPEIYNALVQDEIYSPYKIVETEEGLHLTRPVFCIEQQNMQVWGKGGQFLD